MEALAIFAYVLCNDVLLILRDSHPYATCAFVGC
jgi:hypothetical protein